MDRLLGCLAADSWRARFAFAPQPLRAVRVVQTVNGSKQWRIHELRAFDGEAPISRNGWQVTAEPFPWGIGKAFDNNPVTFWECGDALRAGMYVEAAFSGIQQADSVVIESSPNQPELHLRLMGQDSSGQWKPLASEPEMSTSGCAEAAPCGGARIDAKGHQLRPVV